MEVQSDSFNILDLEENVHSVDSYQSESSLFSSSEIGKKGEKEKEEEEQIYCIKNKSNKGSASMEKNNKNCEDKKENNVFRDSVLNDFLKINYTETVENYSKFKVNINKKEQNNGFNTSNIAHCNNNTINNESHRGSAVYSRIQEHHDINLHLKVNKGIYIHQKDALYERNNNKLKIQILRAEEFINTNHFIDESNIIKENFGNKDEYDNSDDYDDKKIEYFIKLLFKVKPYSFFKCVHNYIFFADSHNNKTTKKSSIDHSEIEYTENKKWKKTAFEIIDFTSRICFNLSLSELPSAISSGSIYTSFIIHALSINDQDNIIDNETIAKFTFLHRLFLLYEPRGNLKEKMSFVDIKHITLNQVKFIGYFLLILNNCINNNDDKRDYFIPINEAFSEYSKALKQKIEIPDIIYDYVYKNELTYKDQLLQYVFEPIVCCLYRTAIITYGYNSFGLNLYKISEFINNIVADETKIFIYLLYNDGIYENLLWCQERCVSKKIKVIKDNGNSHNNNNKIKTSEQKSTGVYDSSIENNATRAVDLERSSLSFKYQRGPLFKSTTLHKIKFEKNMISSSVKYGHINFQYYKLYHVLSKYHKKLAIKREKLKNQDINQIIEYINTKFGQDISNYINTDIKTSGYKTNKSNPGINNFNTNNTKCKVEIIKQKKLKHIKDFDILSSSEQNMKDNQGGPIMPIFELPTLKKSVYSSSSSSSFSHSDSLKKDIKIMPMQHINITLAEMSSKKKDYITIPLIHDVEDKLSCVDWKSVVSKIFEITESEKLDMKLKLIPSVIKENYPFCDCKNMIKTQNAFDMALILKFNLQSKLNIIYELNMEKYEFTGDVNDIVITFNPYMKYFSEYLMNISSIKKRKLIQSSIVFRYDQVQSPCNHVDDLKTSNKEEKEMPYNTNNYSCVYYKNLETMNDIDNIADKARASFILNDLTHTTNGENIYKKNWKKCKLFFVWCASKKAIWNSGDNHNHNKDANDYEISYGLSELELNMQMHGFI